MYRSFIAAAWALSRRLPVACAAPLRPRHQRFVDEYLQDYKANRAYERAGYRARGHAAEASACRLRQRPDVAAAIRELLDQQLAAIDAEGEAEERRRCARAPRWRKARAAAATQAGDHGVD